MPPSGQKAGLTNKIQGIFHLGYILGHLNFEQKSLEIQIRISPFSALRAPGYGFEKAISTGDEMLSLSKQGFFFFCSTGD